MGGGWSSIERRVLGATAEGAVAVDGAAEVAAARPLSDSNSGFLDGARMPSLEGRMLMLSRLRPLQQLDSNRRI